MVNKLEKKKILFVFHSEEKISGATRSMLQIVTYLQQTGKYEIEAVFPKPNGTAAAYLETIGIRSHHYTYGRLMQNLSQPLLKRMIKFPFMCIRMMKMKSSVRKAAKELKDKGFDIVYSNTSSIVFGGFLGKKLGCKQAWHIREFRKLDHNIGFFLGEKYLLRHINRCSDAVFYVSKSVMDYHTNIIDPDKSYVTYSSYSPEFICPKDQFNFGKTLHVLIAGDVKPSKGQFDCVKAIKIAMDRQKDADFELHIAGRPTAAGNYYQNMLDYISENNLNAKVHLYGQVKDMFSLRKKMDVGIVASTNEAFGRTTIEGMLSMMAMIGRNTGGTTEQFRDNQTGLLYDGTPDELADKLLFYYNNRKRMQEMAVNGFNECVELYTHDNAAKIVDGVLENI